MKIKEGFILRKLGEQSVVVTVGDASKAFQGMVRLNETSTFLWEQLAKGGKSRGELLQALAAQYGIDEKTAAEGVEAFLSALEEVGCIAE